MYINDSVASVPAFRVHIPIHIPISSFTHTHIVPSPLRGLGRARRGVGARSVLCVPHPPIRSSNHPYHPSIPASYSLFPLPSCLASHSSPDNASAAPSTCPHRRSGKRDFQLEYVSRALAFSLSRFPPSSVTFSLTLPASFLPSPCPSASLLSHPLARQPAQPAIAKQASNHAQECSFCCEAPRSCS